MKTQDFLNLLETHKDKALLFEYAQNQLVGANYHITEIKHTNIESVDCGANIDSWTETVVQLWESPNELGKTEFMRCFKANGILNKVGRIKPFDPNAEIKFEYGNTLFHTTQLFVNDYEIKDQHLIIKLAIEKTDCKAKEACGIIESKVASSETCCTPESGCC
ncbi:DUF6428 family protein [Ichthyenterobacterium sp. W332]|uniref:DUF6428 family protein n=1 Tax=Microcosmobacter mediterraneus TaxID=3075607 RepID=A0ABU2YI52_9FLAO|nr:DUF6428 family protein [Ichthyenterobacterium sp. W332]MDT0557854.1 DUF6428 family protein [Ichthyenterobacterium sp. W332]